MKQCIKSLFTLDCGLTEAEIIQIANACPQSDVEFYLVPAVHRTEYFLFAFSTNALDTNISQRNIFVSVVSSTVTITTIILKKLFLTTATNTSTTTTTTTTSTTTGHVTVYFIC